MRRLEVFVFIFLLFHIFLVSIYPERFSLILVQTRDFCRPWVIVVRLLCWVQAPGTQALSCFFFFLWKWTEGIETWRSSRIHEQISKSLYIYQSNCDRSTICTKFSRRSEPS